MGLFHLFRAYFVQEPKRKFYAQNSNLRRKLGRTSPKVTPQGREGERVAALCAQRTEGKKSTRCSPHVANMLNRFGYTKPNHAEYFGTGLFRISETFHICQRSFAYPKLFCNAWLHSYILHLFRISETIS